MKIPTSRWLTAIIAATSLTLAGCAGSGGSGEQTSSGVGDVPTDTSATVRVLMENVPDTGGALVVANHSGTLPVDALMTTVALHDEHPAQRRLRLLGADLVFDVPFVGSMARKLGTTLACNEDAERLLPQVRGAPVVPLAAPIRPAATCAPSRFEGLVVVHGVQLPRSSGLKST